MADDFDALMSGMGVKRLGKKTATPPSKKAKSNVVRRKRAGVSTLPKATPQDAAVTVERIEALEALNVAALIERVDTLEERAREDERIQSTQSGALDE